MNRLRLPLALTAILALVALVYAPGLSGPFVFDDGPNILEPPGVRMTALSAETFADAWRSNGSGPLGRPLAALSFALNHYAAGGFDALPFKITNLLIHLACVVLGAVLVRRLLALAPPGSGPAGMAPWTLGLAAAALWGLHPINLTSVLYVVQRMTSLSALCVLAGLLVWLAGRQRLAAQPRSAAGLMLVGVALGAGIGVLAKENAVLMPLYAAAIELTLLRASWARLPVRSRRVLGAFWALVIGLPALAVFTWLAMYPDWLAAGYAGRPFTLGERLLTQARVLWFYLSLIGLPDISRYGLYHDDLVTSTGLLSPPTTVLALGGWVLAAAAAWHWRARAPWLAFGLAWFVAGHALESTAVPLELVHEHRNYLPALGLIGGVVVTAAGLPLRPTLRTVALAGLGGVFALVTATRAFTWSDDAAIIHALYRHHPHSAAANRMMGELALKRSGNPVRAVEYYTRAARLAPHETGYALWPLTLRGALHLPPAVQAEEIEAATTALRTRPLTPSTLYVLRNLTDCVDRSLPDCTGMEAVVTQWLETARHASPAGERRRSLTVDLGRVYLATGALDEGQALMNEALTEGPNDALYLTIAANVALLRGELDASEALLARAQAAGPDAGTAGHIATLREAARARRRGQTRP